MKQKLRESLDSFTDNLVERLFDDIRDVFCNTLSEQLIGADPAMVSVYVAKRLTSAIRDMVEDLEEVVEECV